MRWALVATCVGLGCGKDTRGVMADGPSISDAPSDIGRDMLDAAPDAAPLTLDCASYCSAITAACTGAQEQYESAANCMSTCAQISTTGALSDTSGNTLGCRIFHTDLARTDPVTHCEHAGPSGGDTCGTPCNAACDLIDQLCPSLTSNQWQNSCATNCASVPGSTAAYSTTTAMSGDTVECRVYHATTGDCTNAARTSSTACQ